MINKEGNKVDLDKQLKGLSLTDASTLILKVYGDHPDIPMPKEYIRILDAAVTAAAVSTVVTGTETLLMNEAGTETIYPADATQMTIQADNVTVEGTDYYYINTISNGASFLDGLATSGGLVKLDLTQIDVGQSIRVDFNLYISADAVSSVTGSMYPIFLNSGDTTSSDFSMSYSVVEQYWDSGSGGMTVSYVIPRTGADVASVVFDTQVRDSGNIGYYYVQSISVTVN